MYAPYARKRDLEQRVKSLRGRLARLRGVSLQVQGLRSAEVSALISVGTRTVGEALGDHVTTGRSFKSLLNSRGVDLEALLYSEKSTDALFPWDFIDLGLDKKRLYSLYKEKAD